MGVLSNPFVEDVARPLFRQWYRRQTPRVLSAEQRAFWDANGFLVLPGHFSREQIDAVNGHIDQLWQESRTARRETVVDIFIGTPREKRTHLSDAPLEARLTPHKLNDLYLESDVIRQIVLEERLASVLEEVLEGPPLVCNSLNLEFGSQQRDHTDSLYMTAPVGLVSRGVVDRARRRLARFGAAALLRGQPQDSAVPVLDRRDHRGRRRDAALLRIHAARAGAARDQGRNVRAEDWRRRSSGTASSITAASRSRIRR